MAGRALGCNSAGVALVLVAFLTVHASAQGGSLPPGPIYLTDPLVVEPGETLTIGANTSITGPGRIEVWGSLVIAGAAGAPAELSVPVLLLGNGTSSFAQARFWGQNATAVEARAGGLTLSDVLFEGNARALFVGGAARVEARDTILRDHPGEALYVEERGDVMLERVTFSGNGRGATVYSAERFHVNDSSFLGNGQHIVIDLVPWSPAADIVLSGNHFGEPASTPAQLPAIVLRHDPPILDGAPQRTVRLVSNEIERAPVAIRAEGRGLFVHSVNDTLVDNGVGFSVQLATVLVEGGTFGNDRDVEGSGKVSLDGVTYLRDGAALAAETAPRGATLLPWALGGGVLLFVGAFFLVRRLAPRAPAPARLDAPPTPAPVVEAPPSPPAPAALSVIERRILEDILARPGTAQKAVADRLGMTRQALHYHVKKLEARGLVVKAVDGRETRCTVPPAVAAMLQLPG